MSEQEPLTTTDILQRTAATLNPLPGIVAAQQTSQTITVLSATASTLSTTADSFTQLAGAPTLSVGPGTYLLFYGGNQRNSTAGKDADMTVYFEGAVVTGAETATAGGSIEYISVLKMVLFTTSAAGTLALRYRRNGASGTAEFNNSLLIAMKVS